MKVSIPGTYSSGCNDGSQHLGEFANIPSSVQGNGIIMDPAVGRVPLHTVSCLD